MPLSLEQIVDKVAPVAQKHNLKAVWVFGSHARGEATAKSDVDLLIDIEGATGAGWMCGGIYNAFEDQFGKGNVDMVTLDSFKDPLGYLPKTKERFRRMVLRERKQVYERQG